MAVVFFFFCCAAHAQTARVVLRWKALPGMTGYQVQIARETSFSQIVLDEKVTDPVLKWESLPSTTFYWRVRSFDAEGRASEWSAPRQIAPATGPPAPKLPADGATVTCSTEPIALGLELSPVLKDYTLELSPDAKFTPADTTVLQSKTGQFVLPLAVGTYSWRGRGVDLTGRTTEPSQVRKLIVRLAAPRPKVTPDVPAGTPSVTLDWFGSPCARRYVVEATHETPERSVHEAQETSLSFKPAGLGEYRFRVAARDDKGNQSDWSAESSFRVRLPPPVARGEKVGTPGLTGSDVELSWNAAPQAASYLVEVAKSETFTNPLSFGVTALTHKTVLPPGKYLWRVTARDAEKHLSFPSDLRGFAISDAAPPSKVALMFPKDGATLVRPMDGLIGVNWSKSTSAVTHELEVDGTVRTVGAPPTRVELSVGEHVLRIRAVGVTGKSSEWSPEVRFVFGRPEVVAASATLDLWRRVEIRLLDVRGRVVTGVKPDLSVDFGSLSGLRAEGQVWIAQWLPPPDLPAGDTLTLTVSEGVYRGQHPLQLSGDFSALTFGIAAGARFNPETLAGPAGMVSLGYRPPLLGGRLAAHLRLGVNSAVTAAGRITGPSLTLGVGAHLDLGHWTLRGIVGGGAQVAVTSIGGFTRGNVLPAFEVAGAFGRRLGPGAVELELSFLYSRLNNPITNLQAAGLFVGIGYRLDLFGGK